MSRSQDDFEDEGTLVVEQRFAIVPEWVIDADISDCAFRLYAVLLRYGQTSGQRMPGRALLARRLHKSSKDSVDRALKDLVRIGAVRVERRRTGRESLTNRYHVMSTPPNKRRSVKGGGRRNTATPSRTDAATLAAGMRPNPESSTQTTPPPAPPAPQDGGGGRTASGRAPAPCDDAQLLAACGVEDIEDLAAECAQRRERLGRSAVRWTGPRLLEVLREAVTVQGWPAGLAVASLLRLAADSATQSPMRLAAPGPWWDAVEGASAAAESGAELAALEARLAESDGRRLWVQRRARAELTDQGQAVTRLTVARRACELLDEAEERAC